METGEYLPNSNKSKTDRTEPLSTEKRVIKAVSGTATTKKRSEIRRFAESFISEDLGSIKSHMITNILVPAVKKAASDTVATMSNFMVTGFNTMLYGEAGRNILNRGGGSRTSYGSFYGSVPDIRPKDAQTPVSVRPMFGNNYEDITNLTLVEAQDILSQMDEILDQYHIVSVADLYDLAGLKRPYTNVKYGWTDLRQACSVPDGVNEYGVPVYRLKFPRALPLD